MFLSAAAVSDAALSDIGPKKIRNGWEGVHISQVTPGTHRVQLGIIHCDAGNAGGDGSPNVPLC
jgi:hypothetical protein